MVNEPSVFELLRFDCICSFAKTYVSEYLACFFVFFFVCFFFVFFVFFYFILFFYYQFFIIFLIYLFIILFWRAHKNIETVRFH